MEGPQVKKFGILAVFIGLFILVTMIFYPFLTVITWSGLFYAFLYPLYRRLAMRRDGTDRKGFARAGIAAALALGGILLIAVPAVLLGLSMVRQLGSMIHNALLAIEQNPSIIGISPDGAIASFLYTVSDGSIDISKLKIPDEIRSMLTLRTDRIVVLSGQFLKVSGSIVLSLVFMIFTLFFLLLDGRQLIKVLISAIPIEKTYTAIFLRKFRDMGRHLVTGYVAIAGMQALVMFVLCAIFKVKGVLVIAALTAMASFIPMVGTALVWLPISASKIMAGDITGGVLFFVCAAILIWTLDNFIRPVLLHDRLKIHPLLIFFSILGGLQVLKFNGLVLGPLILILFFTALELYDQAYESPPEEQKRRKGDIEGTQASGKNSGDAL
ncbi:MAG: AI-2E family transporter [Rectinemataceae bacterium]|jgi:predicted PurR-regulated permease PerM